jgi:hypothetical protein
MTAIPTVSYPWIRKQMYPVANSLFLLPNYVFYYFLVSRLWVWECFVLSSTFV